ncbi:MAG: phosphotransferase [Alphaproteobacteria bacterium]|nr:phosphotransferase [Alphaproteobacteria bacterium]
MRDAAIDAFLTGAGWEAARREKLPGDASFRRYVRLHLPEGSAMLMDAPPAHEDVRPFARVARHLASMGYSAPRLLAEDEDAGFLLLEDLGDATYTRELARGADERALYAMAVDLLIDLHRRADAMASGVPPYDDARLLAEAALLIDWYMPAVDGAAVTDDARESYLAAWRAVLPLARRVPDTLVLRDYHVDNLMVVAGRAGFAACGLLDFQDAVIGPASYDLVSLLEDARRDLAPGLVGDMLARYLAAFPKLDHDAFRASYAIMGAQRNAKIVGIFTRLCRRDGKPRYLSHIPRVWRLLEGDLKHPALAPVCAWFDRHLPPERRIVPAAAG